MEGKKLKKEATSVTLLWTNPRNKDVNVKVLINEIGKQYNTKTVHKITINRLNTN